MLSRLFWFRFDLFWFPFGLSSCFVSFVSSRIFCWLSYVCLHPSLTELWPSERFGQIEQDGRIGQKSLLLGSHFPPSVAFSESCCLAEKKTLDDTHTHATLNAFDLHGRAEPGSINYTLSLFSIDRSPSLKISGPQTLSFHREVTLFSSPFDSLARSLCSCLHTGQGKISKAGDTVSR